MAKRRRPYVSTPLLGPTPERVAHGGLLVVPGESAGSFLRISKSPIELYSSRREITSRQADAARVLRRSYELGVIGVVDGGRSDRWLSVVTPYRPDSLTPSQFRLHEIEKYKRYIAALDPPKADVVTSVVCDPEVSCYALACRRHADGSLRSRRTLRDQYMADLRNGLTCLADFLGLAPDEVLPNGLFRSRRRRIAANFDANARLGV